MNAAQFGLPLLLVLFCVDATSAQNQGHSSSIPVANSATSTPPEYTITLIDEPHEFLRPYGLNNSGEVTGQRLSYPFIYKYGVLSNLCCIDGAGMALNDAGDIVGQTDSTVGPFLYTAQSGQFTILDLGQRNLTEITATGINNADETIGFFLQKNAVDVQGFLYRNGNVTLLPPQQEPKVINNHGEFAGDIDSVGPEPQQGFLSTHGFNVTISPPPGLSLGVTGLDSSGRVTGYVRNDSATVFEPFTYTAGVLNIFPTPPNFMQAAPGGMNDCGEFVGYFDTVVNSISIFDPFLYTHGVFKSLGYLLTTAPYNTFEPLGINNRGDIFGNIVDGGVPAGMIMVRNVPETCGTDATIVNTPSSSIVGPGGQVTYTIEATNVNAPTTQFTVTNTVGRESHLLGCAVAGNSGSCIVSADHLTASINLPDLGKGKTATITLSVSIAGSAGDQQLVMDTATLSSNSTSDYLSTAYTNIRLTADVSLSASLVSNSDGLLHYQATVTDLGPNNSHAALLLDPLPANTSFVSATTDYGVCSFHPTLGPYGSVRCPLGNLGYRVPARVDVVLQAAPAACPSVSNTFSLSSQSIDTNSSNDSSTVVTPLSGAECISDMAKQP